MNRPLLAAAITLVLCACTAESPSIHTEPSKARGAATQPVQPRSGDYALPSPASLARTDLDHPTYPTPAIPGTRPGLMLRVDASSPESLIASLKKAESTLGPRDLDRLRAALTVVQLLMQRKVAALAVADPSQANLDDQQLLKLAFGDIHGKTIQEVIDYGIRMTPVVAPEGLGAGTAP